jgi:deoxyribonuclease-4
VVDDFDGVLEEFDRMIGLNRLAVVHLNDSKNMRGAAKDRHAPVGAGWIGFKAIRYVVHHPSLQHLPMILETPWIGKDSKTVRPMYEAEIALLRGNVSERFGDEFLDHLERLHHYFDKQNLDPRGFVLQTWETLKNDAKAKKADPREPMERLYDLVVENRLFPDLNEEQINHRITAWFAGKDILKTA